MGRKVSEMTGNEYNDWYELCKLEILFTKNVHVLRLNLPSREKLVEEIKEEIKKLVDDEQNAKR